jgi:uncharacterized phosphosugar-binding protein
LTHSKAVPSRTTHKLFEVADDVIDTGTPVGDACVELKAGDLNVSPLSTLASALTVQLLATRICELYFENGEVPPVYKSANTPGGDAHNKTLEEKYRSRIKRL